MERPHLFTLGYNNKIPKVFSQNLKIFSSWTIGPDYNINVYDHNFAQMYSLCELVSQVSDAAHGPFVLFLFLFFSCGFVLFHYIFSRVWGKTPNKQTNRQTFFYFLKFKALWVRHLKLLETKSIYYEMKWWIIYEMIYLFMEYEL